MADEAHNEQGGGASPRITKNAVLLAAGIYVVLSIVLMFDFHSRLSKLENDTNKTVGDLEKEEEFLNQRSPLYRADKITKPLLIGQGANDPRVKQAESDQIVKAMRDKKKEVEYVVFEDEGHLIEKLGNRIEMFTRAVAFLDRVLAG